MPVPVHPPGIDLEDHRLAPPRPDLACGLHVLREMDVVPLAPDQPSSKIDGRNRSTVPW